MAQWILLGILCATLIWASSLESFKTTFAPYLPQSSYCDAGKADIVPHLPESPIGIWRLSEISMIVNLPPSVQLQFGLQPENVENLLVEAQTLTHWPHALKPTDLKSLYKDNATRQHTSLLNRIWGAFSFINFMILVGLIGMLATFYPCLRVMTGPLLKVMTEYLFLAFIMIQPFLKPILASLCLFLIFWGQNCHSHIGYYLSLTGLTTLCVGLYHSYHKWLSTHPNYYCYSIDEFGNHVKVNQQSTLSQSSAFSILMALMTLLIIPLAIAHDSKLMGYLAVISFHFMIGFSVMCLGLCWMIGFQTDDALFRAIATGLLTQPFILLLEITLSPDSVLLPYLQPFLSPLIIYGHIVYYLSLLIFSASSYNSKHHGFAQMLMIGSLIVSLGIGYYLTIPGLVNVAIVYTIIYSVEKCVELTHGSSLFIVVVFAIFAGIYLTALHLSANPHILLSLITHHFSGQIVY